MQQGTLENGEAPSSIPPLAPKFHKSHVTGDLDLRIATRTTKVQCNKTGGKALGIGPEQGRVTMQCDGSQITITLQKRYEERY